MKSKKLALTVFGCIVFAAGAAVTVMSGADKGEYIREKGDRMSVISPDTDRVSPALNVMLQKPYGWRQIATDTSLIYRSSIGKFDGSTATIPITAELCRQFIDSDCDIQKLMYHNTTHIAYENLIARKNKDIIFVTPPSDEETQLAADCGVELKMTPVALDGFVFITHKDNPVNSLTVEQIQDIYSGKIKNWKDVGGNDEEITAYQREKNSGSQTAMEQMVMKDKKLMDSPMALNIFGMGELIECVAEYQNDSCSIGYTYYYYMSNLYKNPDIKMIEVNGISPDNENLKNGTYPFTVPYYEVIRGDEEAGSSACQIYDYMISDEGQDIIELAGYCSVRGTEID